jgi:tetratricopeptide (TPR) repeat protein
VLAIARLSLAGELAVRRGRATEGIRWLLAAVAKEDSLAYDEPPNWYYPVRQSLGSAYLRVGRWADARAVFEADLKKWPANPWSLKGLELSLEALGKRTEAARCREAFDRAARDADVLIVATEY